jgi:hypothetical protein
MGALVCVSGTASNINYFSQTSGSVKNGSGRIRTRHSISFRVDNRSVSFFGSPDIGEGDAVTVVGSDGGVISGYLVVNDATNVEYFSCGPVNLKNYLGYFFVVVGLVFYAATAVMTLIFGGFGAWLIYLARQQKEAIYSLKAQSRRTAY